MNGFFSRRIAARSCRPWLESLEERLALSTAHAIHEQAALGTISGQITNQTSGKGLRHVQVQLIDSTGATVARTQTNAKGDYVFKVRQNGAYVVHAVTPNHDAQTSPTFAFVPPVGQQSPGSTWSYTTGNSDPANGPVGPYSWDTIAPAGDLPFQSPINITGPATDLSPYLTINYNTSTPSQLINNGHQIQAQYPGNNPNDTITVNGQVFNLAQFHYHDPSETTVNGHGFTMEEHFVNVNSAGADTVVAVFLQLGAHNSALDPILSAAQQTVGQKTSTKIPVGPVNFAGLLPTSLEGWYYEGSLTTPPLSQPVNWFVLATPITLDYAQLKEYEAVASANGYPSNNRPIQPTDGRVLNQSDFDVNFQNTSVAGLNFSFARTS